MKATSKGIKDLLENEIFSNLIKIEEVVLELNIPAEHNEYTISEAIVDIENMRDILIKAINDEVLDMYTFQSRDHLSQHLKRVRDGIGKIAHNKTLSINPHTVPTFLADTQKTKEYVFTTLNLDNKVNGLYEYKSKIKELVDVQEKYNSLLVELERADGIYENTKNEIETIRVNYSESQNLVDKFTQINDKFEKHIAGMENTTSEIHECFTQVERDSTEINEFVDTIHTQEVKLAKAEEETNNLINENKELDKKARELLGLAVGSALGKTFNERKDELKKSERYWNFATFCSMGLLLIAAVLVYIELYNGVAGNTVAASKISLLIPVSAAVWFTASNHNRERKLLEEYAFKSSISLSLDSYRKVLNEELSDNEKEKISDFLINSIEKIYSSPLENISKHSPDGDKLEVTLMERAAKIFR